jgi:hypothetical protein
MFLPETDVLCMGNNVPSWLNVNKYRDKHRLYGPLGLLCSFILPLGLDALILKKATPLTNLLGLGTYNKVIF